MKQNVLSRAVLGLALLSALAAAEAAEFRQVLADKSTIGFTYKQMGVPVEGRFRKFSAQVAFDPAKPAAAKAAFDVDLASVDAGSSDADQEVSGKQWFNTKAFPSARFVSSTVKPVGGNRYEVAGKLSVKGQARDLVFPATFTANGKTGAFEGAFTIRRGDFAIGEGEWSKFDIVANDVQVRFHITAAQ